MRVRDIITIVESADPSVLTVYRGENSGNRNGNFWSLGREYARQFTQTGRDSEVMTRYVSSSDIYHRPDIYAGNENGFDECMAYAKAHGFKGVMFNEGRGEPNSIFVFNKTALKTIKPR